MIPRPIAKCAPEHDFQQEKSRWQVILADGDLDWSTKRNQPASFPEAAR
jgi:hypothetical protein